MPRKAPSTDPQVQLLQTLLVVQLRLAGVPQRNIVKIAGVATKFVSDIIKQIPQDAIRKPSKEA